VLRSNTLHYKLYVRGGMYEGRNICDRNNDWLSKRIEEIYVVGHCYGGHLSTLGACRSLIKRIGYDNTAVETDR